MPFETGHWTNQTGMPVRTGQLPTGASIIFDGKVYVIYQGMYQNVPSGAPMNLNWWVGGIIRSADGITWETAFDGAVAYPSYRMPGMLWVRGNTLYAVMYRGGYSFVDPWNHITAGEIAIYKTTNGTTWTVHQVLTSWPASGTGTNTGGKASDVAFSRGAWTILHAKGSGPGGVDADWLTVGWYAFTTSPSVVQKGTHTFRSLDDGLTWTFVRDMKGVFPFTSNPFLVECPSSIISVARPGVALDRWVMLGGTNFANYSDDAGVSWNNSVASGGLAPAVQFVLPSGGMVFLIAGGLSTGPGEQLSCDYGASRFLASVDQIVGAASTMISTLQFGTAMGEELLAVVKVPGGGTNNGVWHSTNGGENWTQVGTVPTVWAVTYALALTPSGRILMYSTGGGGAVTDLWTCDDAPVGVPTERLLCPDFTQELPPPPLPPLPPPTPIQAGESRLSLRVTATWRPR